MQTTIYSPGGRAAEYAALAVNHYTNCGFGCIYCYVRNMPGQDFDKPPEPKSEQWFVEFCKKAKSIGGKTNARCLLSFTSDPYQPIDRDIKLTRAVLRVLKENGLLFQVLTKGGTAACRDFDLYGKNDLFGTTLTFLDDERSKQYELHAAMPADRIEAIIVAKTKCIFTWVSLEPVISTEASLQIIEQTHSIVDHYKLGILNYYKIGNPDWRDYGIKALDLLHKFGNSYYVKQDLAKYLAGIAVHNTETRWMQNPAKAESLFERRKL